MPLCGLYLHKMPLLYMIVHIIMHTKLLVCGALNVSNLYDIKFEEQVNNKLKTMVYEFFDLQYKFL